MPWALYALTAGSFAIGVTEFVVIGLLLEVSGELNATIAAAGLLVSGYALVALRADNARRLTTFLSAG